MSERPVKCGQCLARAGTFENPITPCPGCGAELIRLLGNWYWRKKPTGIDRNFRTDENGKLEDEWGNPA